MTTETASTTRYYYIQKPHAFMRANFSRAAKIDSDANHGEEVEVVEWRGKWALIRTKADQYLGWVQPGSIIESSSNFFDEIRTIGKTNQLRVHIYSKPDTEQGPSYTLGYGSRFKILDETDPRWVKIKMVSGIQAYVQRGDITQNLAPLPFDQIVPFSQRFLDIPYTWGGRSSIIGYDCSGFTQMLYQEMGISLPRDSKDQFTDPQFKSVSMDQLQPGDLIFWGTSEAQIRHVGMYTGNQEFIHSTVQEQAPRIHISRLDSPDWNGTNAGRPFVAGRRIQKHPAAIAEEKQG